MEARRRRVLELVIEGFVATARPVPSHELAQPLGVSSATVRNEFMALEELGLLAQPHTAAGRVPTPEAYRRYARSHLPGQPLPASVQERLEQALERAEGEARLRLATRLAARVSGYAAAGVVCSQDAHLERVFLSLLEGGRVLVVLLLEGNVTREFIVDVGFRVERATLERVEEMLRGEELSVRGVVTRLEQLELQGSPGVSRVARALRERWGDAAPDIVFSEGTMHILAEPESSDVGFVRKVLELLERPEGAKPGELALRVDEPSGVSAVAAGFRAHSVHGSVVIVGPTRMRYVQVMSVARTVSDMLSS